jgi:acetolactate synthase-1/2/3 large subunit
MERKASDLFVECLEVEGVKYVFGIPGEETLDLNESLANSSVDFIPVRHEQGGAYMADMYGRLTQRAGVCLGTLGPGATNLITAVADAFLDRSPLVALTGQGDLERMHKESHQYIDIVSVMKPVTKWNARLNSLAHHPRGGAQGVQGRPGAEAGPTHIELPEDVMAEQLDAVPLPARTQIRSPEPSAPELLKAVSIIRSRSTRSCWPATASPASGAAPALREFARATGVGVAETFMGKGLLDYEDPHLAGHRSGCSRATTRWRASRTPTW